MSIGVLSLLLTVSVQAHSGEWPVYGGDAGSSKYSTLTKINRSNVAQLKEVWRWKVGETPIAASDSTLAARPGNFQATPLMIGDTLFFPTPFNRVVAMNASTGTPYWIYDPKAYRAGQPSNGTGFVHRGVATWSDGKRRVIFMNSRWNLIAIDAATGALVRTFGDTGVVDLTAQLRRPVTKRHYTNTSPPVVYKNLVIVGNGVGDRLRYQNDPPGDVQAFDVKSGKRVWSFHTIPDSAEFGVDTWENDSWRTAGHTNVWAPFSIDVARGLVYLPVSTPSNDWYGGERKGNNLFGESIVCLDANTGKRKWHHQLVHHGLWDYDLPAPPVLGKIGRVDAVFVPTKMGYLFSFNRVTGEPLWPIVERPVPQSDVPGERTSPTQPVPSMPAPFSVLGMTDELVADFTPEIKRRALDVLHRYRFGELYTPPSLQGTIVMPGAIGGSGWGGGAFDPETGMIYIKTTNAPALYRIFKTDARSDTIDVSYTADLVNSSISVPLDSTTRGRGIPLVKPPYGTMVAIDLHTGRTLWNIPFGDTPDVRNLLTQRGITVPPLLGVAGAPGAIVTRGGLIFATGGGSTLYALDKTSGKTLWSTPLGREGYSVPMTYQTKAGVQHVVIATGSGANAELVAFALTAR